MQEITNQDVLEFLRLLCNLGNLNRLNEDKMTIEKQDGQECAVQEGDQVKPIQILFNGQVQDDNYATLNPFKMVEGNNPALTWFYQSRATVLSALTKLVILKIVELGYTKECEDYDKMKLIAKVSEQCDKTMVDELTKINASDYLRIFYNKKTKTAEAQTAIFTDAIETQYKFRKKTWHVLTDIFRGLFNLSDDECTMAKYSYRAKVLSIPKIDAELHVMSQLITALDPWTQSLLSTDLHAEEFAKHVGRVETYARMYAWFTSKVVTGKQISTVSNHIPGSVASPAWNNQPAVPVTTNTSSENDIKVDMNPSVPSAIPMATAPMPVVTSNMPAAIPAVPAYAAPMMPTMQYGAIPASPGVLAGPNPMPCAMPGQMPNMMPMMMNQPIGLMQPQQMPMPNQSTAEENVISVNC